MEGIEEVEDELEERAWEGGRETHIVPAFLVFARFRAINPIMRFGVWAL